MANMQKLAPTADADEMEAWEALLSEHAAPSLACCFCGAIEPDLDGQICRDCWDEITV